MGLNCHYIGKVDSMAKRLEAEVILNHIYKLEDQGVVSVGDSLRPLLLAEAIKKRAPPTAV